MFRVFRSYEQRSVLVYLLTGKIIGRSIMPDLELNLVLDLDLGGPGWPRNSCPDLGPLFLDGWHGVLPEPLLQEYNLF